MQAFDANTGRVTAITAGPGNAVANFSYTYNALGQLASRADANTSLTETFAYDSLNRLASAMVGASVAPQKLFTRAWSGEACPRT